MEHLEQYIKEVLGETIQLNKLTNNQMNNIPIHISLSYNIYKTILLDNEIILIEYKDIEGFKILQIDKHIAILRKAFDTNVVLVLSELASYNRLRLIDKRINFIVAGKQLYIPALLIDLREPFTPNKKLSNLALTPSAQVIVLYHILNQDVHKDISNISFKELAEIIGYTPMSISKAVDNLKQLELIEVEGLKEKRILFTDHKKDLWIRIKESLFFCNPVVKKIFVDEIPQDVKLLLSNESALAEYSDMNPSRQDIFALDKKMYHTLQKKDLLINENINEGKYCIEVWKYNPLILAELFNTNISIVDPLSLYYSLIHDTDERIDMALDKIEKKYLW
ncbi:MAG: helix-turn-helix domain-containing protein [Marinifilaceae bacterium]